MPTPILMPALSPTMEAGTLAKWLVKEGDKVASGDVIAEIETDKATMEVEAVDEGVVGRILVKEGTADVPVNEPIAMLLGEGEDASALEGGASGGKEGGAPASPPTKAPATAAAPTDGGQKAAETAPGGIATGDHGGAMPAAGASGGGSTGNGASRGNGAAPSNGAAPGEGGRVFASPLARRMAAEKGVDLSAIAGSGPHGRVVKRDVEEAKPGAKPAAQSAGTTAAAPSGQQTPAAPTPAAKAPPPTGAPAGMSDDQIRAMFEPGAYKELPHDGMRKTIARRLVESKQTIPHFYLTVDCELDALLKLRADLNAAAPTGEKGPSYKLSVNDFVIKAMALALKAVPMANATFTSTARLLHENVDVGVAVAIPDGLITPVIRKADQKPLSVISNEMKDLAKRARDKKLQPSEYQGGSTAVSNLGMFGIREFAAVINPPHGSILAVGEGAQRAVVKGGALAVATVMTVTLSVDHRAVDGALGAEVLQAFKGLIENPIRMLV
jgi:pyruvate dehydrogenase E2 component (dihydrolipoamide acetyltransferase)